MGIMIGPTAEPPEPEPGQTSPLDAYLVFHPWCTEYVRLLLRNSAKRNGIDVREWPE